MQKVSKVDDNNPIITSRVVNSLADLMDAVTKQEVTPETVNAACNCAGKITEIFKFHLEFEKFKTKVDMLKN